MVISAEELGWIIAVGFAVAFAAELALSAYISRGRAKQPINADFWIAVASKNPPPLPSSRPPAQPVAKIEGEALNERERLYASGNRKRDNSAPGVHDRRPRSRLYAKPER
jgi:hypothetical protein